MPIYEYTCAKCHHEFELLVRGGDVPECPRCRGRELAKRWSVPAAHAGRAADLPMGAEGTPRCGAPACGSGCQWTMPGN